MDFNSGASENTQKPIGSQACKGLTPSAIPEVSTAKDVETHIQGCPPDMLLTEQQGRPQNYSIHWYVLRAAYGSEKLTYEYIHDNSPDIEVFWPTHIVDCKKKGKITHDRVSLIPNLLFARGSKASLENFVYDNNHLPYLRFYYSQYHKDGILMREPLVVPDRQMKSFRKIYDSAEDDIYIAGDVIPKFKEGQMVRVIAGPFEGVVGRVARFKGQQRVGVIMGGICTAVTTYIKNRYLQPI